MVYSLLSMLGTHDKDDMSRTLLAMSSSLDSCIAMRQSGEWSIFDYVYQ
jgi:adenomatosis polyposis coli protein